MILLLSYLTNEVVATKCLWELLVLILGVQVDCRICGFSIHGFSYPRLAAARKKKIGKLLLSEHKHCDNVATNLNRENASSRMVVSLWGGMGTGTKEDESSTGRIWAAGLHHVMVLSCLARVLKLINCLFLQFSEFFWTTVNRGYGGPPVHYPPSWNSPISFYLISTFDKAFLSPNFIFF